jgi:hypothetical protein
MRPAFFSHGSSAAIPAAVGPERANWPGRLRNGSSRPGDRAEEGACETPIPI